VKYHLKEPFLEVTTQQVSTHGFVTQVRPIFLPFSRMKMFFFSFFFSFQDNREASSETKKRKSLEPHEKKNFFFL
jgi:hypothetical protein